MARLVVVTGAGGAIGRVIVRHLLANGYGVAAIDRPGSERHLQDAGSGSEMYVPLAFDVTQDSNWQSALDLAERQIGALCGAVLVAGGWRGGSDFVTTPESTWRELFAMNLDSARVALQAVLPRLIARRSGSVVVFGSRAVSRPWESAGAAAYASSKAALLALAQVAAAECLEHGVRVNALLPSTVDTPANRAAMPDADPARWVSPDSLAQVVEFLLSDAARDISGAALPIYARV